MLANNTREVIERLDAIAKSAADQNNPIGLFAALYRLVTLKLIVGIENGFFDDASRMEQYITQFANRYFEAFNAYHQGGEPTKSWKIAFAATSRQNITIVQHLLLGANAHINLDLGIVAAEICPGDKLQTLADDFNKTNIIFADLLDSVQEVINEFSPKFRILDTVGGKVDEGLMNFSLSKARAYAWHAASILAYQPPTSKQAIINLLDSKVALLSRILTSPGRTLDQAIDTIKKAESNDIKAIINAINSIAD